MSKTSTQQNKDDAEELKIPNLRPGLYQHYKGNKYWVHEIALHSESTEPLVVYRCLYGDHHLWVRPYEMFFEDVILESGERVPRFAFLGDTLPEALSSQLTTAIAARSAAVPIEN